MEVIKVGKVEVYVKLLYGKTYEMEDNATMLNDVLERFFDELKRDVREGNITMDNISIEVTHTGTPYGGG
jgi:hypothetical protein